MTRPTDDTTVAAKLLPSECPNCGRLHQGHDFNETPGPVQIEVDYYRVRMMVAVSFLDSETLDKFHEHVAEIDAKHREGTYGR